MTTLRDCDKKYFPLHNIPSTIKLFKSHLENNISPNLTLLSIVIGAIENSMTCGGSGQSLGKPTAAADHPLHSPSFPSLDWLTVETLYYKFQSQIKGSVNLASLKTTSCASRELIKRVSDVIWSSLTRSCHKDRAHLQSLYSYLTGNKLDCFGIAFAVVAACQLLGFNDVHLALSEDHAWVVFGTNSEETAEVTWHGKTHEDKRGQSITLGVEEKSWLYLNGHPVKCTRHMEVAAMVSSINPSVNTTMDNIEVATLQQGLMWLLFDLGHLEKYPMALANLGDLEEISPTPSRLSSEALFHKAIESARTYYNNQHVYPYTYLGGYYYRNRKFKEALEAWANAAGVIKKFNYNREDEEIYKEFLEIANELIPNLIKMSCLSNNLENKLLLQDPECFGYLLRFYDSICKWEEGSSTPVLHIGWAKPLVNTISKFDAMVRSHVTIMLESQGEEVGDGNNNHQVELKNSGTNDSSIPEDANLHPKTKMYIEVNKAADSICDKNEKKDDAVELNRSEQIGNVISETTDNSNNNNSELFFTETEDLYSNQSFKCSLDFIKCLENEINPNEEPHPNIAALAAACSENILNPEYLLSSGQPFLSPVLSISSSNSVSSLAENKLPQDFCDSFNFTPDNTAFQNISSNSNVVKSGTFSISPLSPPLEKSEIVNNKVDENIARVESRVEELSTTATPKILLQSEKMKGLKDLLLAKKLNVSAIQLQLTAQSQVLVVKRTKSSATDFDFIGINNCTTTRSNKRSRRE